MATMAPVLHYRVDNSGALYVVTKRLGRISQTALGDGSSLTVLRRNGGIVLNFHDTPDGYRWHC